MGNKEDISLSEIFVLWWIRFKNKIYLFFIDIIELFTLIRNKKLWQIGRDIKNFQKYEFSYEKLDREREKVNTDREELTYGETLYFTSFSILKEAGAGKDLVVYDLGSGLGKFAFLANLLFKAKVKGIEIIPSFIEFAKGIVKKYDLKNISFIEENLFESDYTDADVIYIAGTCFNEKSKKLLENKMGSVKKGAKVITLSYSLKSPNLRLKKLKKMWFSWGWGTVFFQEVI